PRRGAASSAPKVRAALLRASDPVRAFVLALVSPSISPCAVRRGSAVTLARPDVGEREPERGDEHAGCGPPSARAQVARNDRDRDQDEHDRGDRVEGRVIARRRNKALAHLAPVHEERRDREAIEEPRGCYEPARRVLERAREPEPDRRECPL